MPDYNYRSVSHHLLGGCSEGDACAERDASKDRGVQRSWFVDALIQKHTKYNTCTTFCDNQGGCTVIEKNKRCYGVRQPTEVYFTPHHPRGACPSQRVGIVDEKHQYAPPVCLLFSKVCFSSSVGNLEAYLGVRGS